MSAGRIDVHHHLLPDFYLDAVGRDLVGAPTISGAVPSWSFPKALETLDENEIATAILSFSTPGMQTGRTEGDIRLAEKCNEYSATLCTNTPGRFGFFASLPLPDVDGSLAEIGRSFDTLQADGVCLMTNYGGLYLGDSHFTPVLQELDRRGATVFVHPTFSTPFVTQPMAPAAMLEFPFDTTRTIVSLLFSGATVKFPNIKFIFSHGGGTLPFLAGRIASLASKNPELNELMPGGISAELQKMYFDLALSANSAVLRGLLEVIPSDHILFGTDFPFGRSDQAREAVAGVMSFDIDSEIRHGIERRNALTLFPRLRLASE